MTVHIKTLDFTMYLIIILVWYNCVILVDNGKLFVTTDGIALNQLLLANSWDIRIQVRLAYDTFVFNLSSICLNHRVSIQTQLWTLLQYRIWTLLL